MFQLLVTQRSAGPNDVEHDGGWRWFCIEAFHYMDHFHLTDVQLLFSM
jgi:hypothetical protein